MSERRRLPNRRASLTFDIESQGLTFTVTASHYDSGELGEIFIVNHKGGSMAGINASDAAVVCSIALQYGVPRDVTRKALMRDSQGGPSGPLAKALDAIAERSP
jgi:ribonucleoside-diphosphate reductase alpha chain